MTERMPQSQRKFKQHCSCSLMYQIKIYDGSSTYSTLLGTYSGSSLPSVVVSSGSSLLVHFTSDNIEQKTGFAASYQQNVEASSCSGTTYLYDASGSFTDGSYTYSDYTNGLSCKWLIQPNYSKIKLSFTRFATESTLDTVKIYDGSSTYSTLLASYSGTSLPASVVSTGSSMLVVFTTDSTQTKTGFYATYEQEATTCSGQTTLTASSSSFTDGSVPSMPYLNNKLCSWLISPGYAPISLSFNRFRTQSGYDLVKVRFWQKITSTD
eukprot:scaffold3443_cov33-Prasinocladus_malaysianus.AAC.3